MFMPLAAFSIIEFFNVFVDSRVFTDLATMARLHINYAKMDILPKALFHALETVCQNYSGNDESRNEQIVKMKDDIIVAAKKHKFCREVKYNVKQLGPHPCNREGEGISDVRAQSRVMVIKAGGFSAPTIRPNCISMQENPITKHIEAFTLKQCAKNPKYARYEAKSWQAVLGQVMQRMALRRLLTKCHATFPRFLCMAACPKSCVTRIQALSLLVRMASGLMNSTIGSKLSSQ